MKNAQVQSYINKLKDELLEPDYPVFGFHFNLDQPEDQFFNPHTWTNAEKVGFSHRPGMPGVEGFFYVSEEYENYLNVLKETKMEHPANILKLPWSEETIDPGLSTI